MNDSMGHMMDNASMHEQYPMWPRALTTTPSNMSEFALMIFIGSIIPAIFLMISCACCACCCSYSASRACAHCFRTCGLSSLGAYGKNDDDDDDDDTDDDDSDADGAPRHGAFSRRKSAKRRRGRVMKHNLTSQWRREQSLLPEPMEINKDDNTHAGDGDDTESPYLTVVAPSTSAELQHVVVHSSSHAPDPPADKDTSSHSSDQNSHMSVTRHERRGNGATVASVACLLRIEEDTDADTVADMVTAILVQRYRPDRVVVIINCPGGSITTYGQMYCELLRLVNHGIELVAVTDGVAASGGYLAICCANHIVCSPFAFIGSIGVISVYQNWKGIMDKVGVHVDTFTAGQHKLGYNPYGDNDDQTKAHVMDELKRIHKQFKKTVKKHRPHVDLSDVATGQVWTGVEAKRIGLVDALCTSSEYLLTLATSHVIYEIKPRQESTRRSLLMHVLGRTAAGVDWFHNPVVQKLVRVAQRTMFGSFNRRTTTTPMSTRQDSSVVAVGADGCFAQSRMHDVV